ncbi:unnamed protein product, partial [Ectocarpus sp. 12 AP-2014]
IAPLVDPCAAAVRLREFATDFAFLPDVTCSLVGLTHACETCLGSIYQTARRQFFFFFRGSWALFRNRNQPRSPQMLSPWVVLGSSGALDILLRCFVLFWHRAEPRTT